MDCSEQQRAACALAGIYTALAINKVLPVLHTGPGCMYSMSGILGKMNGGQNSFPYSETVIPCTDFCESDVVFGGAKHLRKILDNTLKYYDADLIIATDGCAAEIVGDDLEEITGAYEGSRIPIIYAKLPGFKGNNLYGHTQILESIIDQFLEPSTVKNPGQVNVWGIVPYYDPMWQGTLERIEGLLLDLGLKPNIIYGHKKGIEEVKKIPEAELNLLLSPWIDKEIVEKLERKFGTPYFQYPCVPIGPTETGEFIRSLTKKLGRHMGQAEKYIKEQEDRYYYYINRHITWFLESKDFQKNFYMISSASAAVSTVRFAVNDMGMIPEEIYITDGVPNKYQQSIADEINKADYKGGDIKVIFTEDGGLPALELKKKNVAGSIIFGSNWEEITAKELGMKLIPIATPFGNFIVGEKNYFGYSGGIDLFADIATKALGY